MPRRLQKDYPESLLVVVFDAKGKHWDDLFSEYKANRPPMLDDMRLRYSRCGDCGGNGAAAIGRWRWKQTMSLVR